LIAGSIGPLGLGVQSRHPEPEEIQDIFNEQALALEERGVDFYILETFSYIEELLLAIDAIRSFSGLPIVAQLTYAEEGTTYGDVRPANAAEQLKNKNVQVIPTPAFPSAKATASFIQNLLRNILRFSPAKRPRSACAFSAAAAARLQRTSMPWPKP
jgi:methionine synthase I (cobalamin-dependent)